MNKIPSDTNHLHAPKQQLLTSCEFSKNWKNFFSAPLSKMTVKFKNDCGVQAEKLSIHDHRKKQEAGENAG